MVAEPDSVGALIRRLRRILGHLSAKDRALVVQAIDGLAELAVRLHETETPPATAPAHGDA